MRVKRKMKKSQGKWWIIFHRFIRIYCFRCSCVIILINREQNGQIDVNAEQCFGSSQTIIEVISDMAPDEVMETCSADNCEEHNSICRNVLSGSMAPCPGNVQYLTLPFYILFHPRHRKLKSLRLKQVQKYQHLKKWVNLLKIADFNVWSLRLPFWQILRVKNVEKHQNHKFLMRLLKIAGFNVLNSPLRLTQFSQIKQAPKTLHPQVLMWLQKIVSVHLWNSHPLLIQLQHSNRMQTASLPQNSLLV